MAQQVTFDSGSFTISSYLDNNFVLAVSTCIVLAVPAEFSNTSIVAGLRDQVQNGSLWIARAGSCHIELDIGFGVSFEDGTREALKCMCVEAFENFPVWSALGLDLRREYNQFSEIRGSRLLHPYSVQHTQQNSGLIVPDQIPCAYLSTLKCIFTFGPKSTLQAITATRQRLDDPTERSTPLLGASKIITVKAHPDDLRRILGVPGICSLPLHLQEKRLEHLTHTALHLVLGSRKRFSGIQFLKKSESPTALEVAPAVWSSRYFQDFVSRAHLTTFISSALANLVSTEIPSLRHKIQNLGDDPAQEIHRRVLSLVLRSARVPKIQIQEQRNEYQSHNEVDYVFEDDRTHELNISQGNMEEQEQQALPEIRQDGRPHDGSSVYSENSMDPHCGNFDLRHEEISTNDGDSDVNEEPGLGYRLPSLGIPPSNRKFMLDHLEDLAEYENNHRLAGQFSHDEVSYGPHGDNDPKTRGNLVIDAIDENYVDDDMETPVWSTHHNFENEVSFHDYNWQESVSGMHIYGEDIDFGHGHQVHLDAEPFSEPGLPSRPHFLESDEAEGARDEHNGRSYWADQNLTMGSEDSLLPRETDHLQLGFDHHLMENQYDTDSIDCATDEPIGEFREGFYYEDSSMHLTEVLPDEDADVMATQQEELDEGESVDGEFYGNSFNGDVAEAKSAFMLCGEDASRPFTPAFHHSHLSENVLDDSYSQMTGRPVHSYWTASNHCTRSTSAYA